MKATIFLLLCMLKFVLASHSTTLKLAGPPSLPSIASYPLSPALASFSIETAFFVEYVGNSSDPNILTRNLLQNLKDRTGTAAQVRIGGITADSTYWNSTLDTALFNFVDDAGVLHNTTIGPQFWEAVHLLPEGTDIIMNLVRYRSAPVSYYVLSFDKDLHDLNYEGALAVAESAVKGLNNGHLLAFESQHSFFSSAGHY